MDEQDFLRNKTQSIYESTEKIVDVTTGEIIREDSFSKKKTSLEPDFIKVYYKAMLAVHDIEEIPLNFLLAISSLIGYSNGDRVIFFNNKTNRKYISDMCGIGDNMVGKYIKRCVCKGILFNTEDRGTYEVNPWLIAKGKWEHIKMLQTQFSFCDGKWSRRMEIDEE